MLKICWNVSKEKSKSELHSVAIVLYEKGIRPSDRPRMIYEFGLSECEADAICAIMHTLEDN